MHIKSPVARPGGQYVCWVFFYYGKVSPGMGGWGPSPLVTVLLRLVVPPLAFGILSTSSLDQGCLEQLIDALTEEIAELTGQAPIY